jgi:hypothetical protein
LLLTDKNNTTIWQSNTTGPSIDKLYKANLLEKNNRCVLELTDKSNQILWSSPLPEVYPLPTNPPQTTTTTTTTTTKPPIRPIRR